MARTRIKNETYSGSGHARFVFNGSFITNVTQSSVNVGRHQCDDSLGFGVDHALLIEHVHTTPDPLNGRTPASGVTYREYLNFIPTSQNGTNFPSHLPDLGYPSNAALATTLLARTNPGRASVSMPVFIGELRDLPHMVQLAGNSILKRTSSGYLAWEFGWKPLFSDLRKMLDFQATVAKRVRELERLYGKGGLKRRMSLANSGLESHSNVTIDSTISHLVNCRRNTFTARRSWGTVRWKPDTLPALEHRPDLQKLARKAVFGLSLQAEDAWNLIPWTWLIDWFSNAGEYISAHSNRVPCSPSLPNIMTETVTKVDWVRNDALTWLKGGNVSGHRITKNRYLGGAGLSATLPFLSARQLSILGALAITRSRGIR